MTVFARAFGLARLPGALLAVVLFMPLAACAAETFDKQPLAIVTKDGKSHAFTVELAVTPRQREQGLMNRREMAPDHGMLFAFGETRQVFMWMKNTYLPLDMLFIAKDGKVRAIKENAEPLSESIIDSQGPIDYVLELNGGTVKRLGIRAGNRVQSELIESQRKAQ
ncbi:DUF192 domain-containing protein [Shinella kummerowiae]|jgi:uncharacterized membrane protein (UPF0127 family)|uniref:DUF192 domain-containing protein n=1 Tax=Shinella kummerowiae TaxID=417745 RepID=A0A6N8SF89_9HYPH|nr:DUF192 domain-containing protein [Shinella kummerowiae]MXN45986.1 DUF192 domain-containing protein [Shinella kummerowiae]